jgi:anti-sigma factor RsiW
VILRARHLQEDRLFDCYVARRQGEPVDPRVAEHLVDCGKCATRYAALSRFLDDVGAAAEAESDAVFTPERLHVQERQIVRRLDHVGRSARVLSFPGHFSGDHPHASTSRTPPRWVAAVAAAGLFVAAALGATHQWRAPATGLLNASVQQPLPSDNAIAMVANGNGNEAEVLAADELFLFELDLAIDEPRTRELQPFDALTPHVREIIDVQ